jgi:ATP-dependent RNA helicase RhlE
MDGAADLVPIEGMKLTNFSMLGLSAPLLKALSVEGYETPTSIQVKAIPPLLEGRDTLGIAQTGTGKTAAFALPILQLLAQRNEAVAPGACRALILSPTRELAAQIEQSFRAYGRFLKLRTATAYGGVSIGRQSSILRGGVDILVATPGRLVDLVERRTLTLSRVEIFVLDEVDQMLDLGFIHAIRRITGLLPKARQNLFFSATMPKEIASLAGALLKDPVRVEVAPAATTAERVEQHVIHVEASDKLRAVAGLLADAAMVRTLVFTRTKRGADKLARGLSAAGIEAGAIHGNKSQPQRERALAGFKQGHPRVLVATDIAARGIDVDGVSHVVNYDLPHVAEAYVHRIGRTARAGAAGTAISLCDREQRPLLTGIERLIGQRINVMSHPLGAAIPRSDDGAAREVVQHRRHGGQPRRNDRSQRGGQSRRDDRSRVGKTEGSSWMEQVGKRPSAPTAPVAAKGPRRNKRWRRPASPGGQRPQSARSAV